MLHEIIKATAGITLLGDRVLLRARMERICMNIIAVSVIILCVCGLFAGAVLAVASRLLAVKTDPRAEKIEQVLPGANCSGCGYPSCFAYAKAMVDSDAAPDRCVFAGDKAQEICRILGKSVTARAPVIAAIRCYGGHQTERRFIYTGVASCRAASRFDGGDSVCEYSCLGFGDCVRACPVGALSQRQGREPPAVDTNKCGGCGKCVNACPKELIVLIPQRARPHVACNSKDKGKVVREKCPVGCISCMKCVKVCPADAVAMEDNVIKIDYEKCTACGDCIEACPRNIIADLIPDRAKGAAQG